MMTVFQDLTKMEEIFCSGSTPPLKKLGKVFIPEKG
jgi:hypothetical protein